MAILNYQKFELQDDAPWLVLIHGLFGNLDNLSGLRKALQGDFNLLTIDLPDHGQSPRTDQFSFDTCCQLLTQTLDHLSIQQCMLLGHSLGGKVAMTFALSQPQRVSKLVVMDIAPVAYAPRHDNVIAGLQNVDLSSVAGRGDADKQLSQHVEMAGVRQFLLKSLYKDEQAGWQWRFNLPLLARDYERLSQAIHGDTPFPSPVLFVKGGDSDYLTPQHQPAIAKLFPAAQAKIIAGTGHWLHAEKPQIVARVVRTFLL